MHPNNLSPEREEQRNGMLSHTLITSRRYITNPHPVLFTCSEINHINTYSHCTNEFKVWTGGENGGGYGDTGRYCDAGGLGMGECLDYEGVDRRNIRVGGVGVGEGGGESGIWTVNCVETDNVWWV